ncbi:hypothetical protein LX64_04130 [Chitinophaga skermanii]|uniref:Magnesium citrate secondary transporter n=1 Tax=Chitinophaga skermanii TaxID=331697 RepID=A0A327Q962_9BACT|nr:hypothetical protein [Chitinophaga skermanii]RAJ00424.1 hypothetical protein LX64_04130 [Chitinophaga skermanii]
MKRLFDPFFIGYGALWSIVHVARYYKYPLPWLNGHLTDCIAVPAIAHLALTFTKVYILRNSRYTYPLSYLLFIAAYVAIAFEWVMPLISPRYTGDIWDVLAYFVGAFFYYFVHAKYIVYKRSTLK